MTPLVNTDANIKKDLFDALCLFETWCVAKGKNKTSEQEVVGWLNDRYGVGLAKEFKTEFLLS